MNIFSKLRRTIVTEGGVYNVNDLFGSLLREENTPPEIYNPEFYDIETHTLKLGNLCYNETKKSSEPTIEWNNNVYTTYCALLQLSNTISSGKQNELHKNIDIIYNFLRRDLSLDNRRKFHALIKVIFGYDNPDNTMKLIADYINGTYSADEIRKGLDLFRKEDVAESDIEEFLKKAKFTTYKEYENSFVGDHFETKEYKLYLKYRGEEENRTIYNIVKDIMNGSTTLTESVSKLHGLILDNYDSVDMIKGDLLCKKELLDSRGEIIIGFDDVVEVKKLDHAGDSYLSEFFSIYKDSKLPKDAYEPQFLKTYNTLIDSLYGVFSSTGNGVLKDIIDNFAGIIYDENTFIKSDDIQLYWSNKGRGSCSKDHRLSIRYRMKNQKVTGYVYEKNKDILREKEVKVQIDSDLITCPIITSVKESYELSSLSDLLFEGRKEDARAKYEDVDDDVFNYYADNDPSGNQKYLDWILNNVVGVYRGGLRQELMEMVKFFHQQQNMFIEKDINRHNLVTLDREIDDVKEKLLQKEKKKQAKKQSIRLYEDDRWLVISPKSWEASCYYGAGTKWCITMKDNSTYWNRYSRNASFFFIIDKTKPQDDPLYKVAYRRIGRKGRYELWNAPDHEIAQSHEGQRYFQELPEELKNRVDIQHLKDFPLSNGREEWIEISPRAQALINGLGDEDIEDIEDSHYGMPIFLVDGEHYSVGTGDEMDEALRQSYDEYSDEDLIEYYDIEGYYILMEDEESFIDDEIDSYLSNTSDIERIQFADLLDKNNKIESKIEHLEGKLEETYDDEEIEEIESLLDSLRKDLYKLIEEADKITSRYLRSDWERCFRSGVKDCLIDEKGWFSNVSELYNSSLVLLDRENLIDGLVGNSDWDTIAQYGYESSEDDNGNDWYYFKVDY